MTTYISRSQLIFENFRVVKKVQGNLLYLKLLNQAFLYKYFRQTATN